MQTPCQCMTCSLYFSASSIRESDEPYLKIKDMMHTGDRSLCLIRITPKTRPTQCCNLALVPFQRQNRRNTFNCGFIIHHAS